jgi:hypothetical protein
MNEAIHRSLENRERARSLAEEEARQLRDAIAASMRNEQYRQCREGRGSRDDGAGPSTQQPRKRDDPDDRGNALAKKHRRVMEAGYILNTSNFGNKLDKVSQREIAYKQLNRWMKLK